MDRLSQLPDSVICHIFWFLPLHLFVRTTVLSKRWKNLWTTTPFLNFTSSLMRFDPLKKDADAMFGKFVFRALTCWDGERVLKFKIEAGDESAMNGDIDFWARFAKRCHVQELFFHREMDGVFWHGETDHQIHWVPQFLYSCSSLTELSIRFCYFRINENVQWDHLKRLTIDDGFGVNEHVVNQILSGSPRLEVFILSFVERGENLCIRSSSLKELSMFKYFCHGDEPDWYTELTIWTPNLETLEIKGLPYNKCFLMDVSSLTHVTFESSGLHALDYNDDYCDVSKTDGFLSKNHYFGGLFNQTLPSIQHVESVTLSSCCPEVLGAMIERCMNSPFPNVRSLQLKYKLSEYELGLGIIEISPQSKKLLLGVRKEGKQYCDGLEWIRFDAESYLKFEANIPKPFVKELKIVEVTWIERKNVFPFLKFLLLHAAKLEKMMFRVKRIMEPSHQPSNSLLLASQKLLSMPRASPNVQFILCEC